MQGKNVAIIGFGQEGISAANFLGRNNNILIYDDKNKKQIDKELFGELKVEATLNFGNALKEQVDVIVRSPGVRPDHPQIKKLVHSGAKLTSPTNIFFKKCPAQIIGVTGTKGKGTTSALIYKMLETQNKDLFLAGNIGTPMLNILPQLTPDSLVVLELSSFQLMDLKKSPHIAVILMITSEHLDWHKDQKEYINAKFSAVNFQKKKNFAIINKDFEISKSFSTKTPAKVYYFSTKNETNGVYMSGNKIISEINGREEITGTDDVTLPGRHNLQNVAAATAVAKILNIKNSNIAKVLKIFKGLPHRLQLVREVDGVKYYNDSFSTTPETTIAAIESFNAPKILILGGSWKNSNFKNLGRTIKNSKSTKAIILIGEQSQIIKEAIGAVTIPIIEGASTMAQIVAEAQNIAKRGDLVILSPACASFDMFKNYEDRGEQFKKYVLSL